MREITKEEQDRLLKIWAYNNLQKRKGVNPSESTHGKTIHLHDLSDKGEDYNGNIMIAKL